MSDDLHDFLVEGSLDVADFVFVDVVISLILRLSSAFVFVVALRQGKCDDNFVCFESFDVAV